MKSALNRDAALGLNGVAHSESPSILNRGGPRKRDRTRKAGECCCRRVPMGCRAVGRGGERRRSVRCGGFGAGKVLEHAKKITAVGHTLLRPRLYEQPKEVRTHSLNAYSTHYRSGGTKILVRGCIRGIDSTHRPKTAATPVQSFATGKQTVLRGEFPVRSVSHPGMLATEAENIGALKILRSISPFPRIKNDRTEYLGVPSAFSATKATQD